MMISSKKAIWLAFCTIGGSVLLIYWLGHHEPSTALKEANHLSTERLRTYSLATAPKTTSGAVWSTNGNSDPLVARITEQIRDTVERTIGQRPNVSQAGSSNFRNTGQIEALRRLQESVGASLQVYLRSENNTPNQIKGDSIAKIVAGIGDPALREKTTAETFLLENASLFLIDEPEKELTLAHRQTDELGGAVLRYTQNYKGISVWPAEIGFSFNVAGNITLIDCAYISTPNNINIQPKLTPLESEMKARGSVKGGADAKIKSPELIIYSPLDQPARLAWRIEVSVSINEAWWIVVDAQDGQTLTSISRVMNDSVIGSGVDLLGINRPLNVSRSGGTFFLRDESKPMFNAITGQGFILVEDAREADYNNAPPHYHVTSASSNTWSIPDAVSASFNLSKVYDFYQERFNRLSYNGKGSNINALVRLGNYNNASWNGELKQMNFGNSDRYAASLDVVGHEVTHGIASSIGSQGVLLYQNQSGALNEAFADIFGEMIEARTRGTNDWLLGSELSSASRNMKDPGSFQIGGTSRSYPARMSDVIQPNDPFLNGFPHRDSGGVHLNSGIINRAYYLLAAGLHDAIGTRDSEQIFYRCLTVSMRPFSQFIDARLGCVAAAEALYGPGSQQALKTAEAFDAVELFAAPASANQPANVNAAVNAPDSLLFIRKELEQRWVWDFWPILGHWEVTGYHHNLCRREASKNDPQAGKTLVTYVKATRPSVTSDGELSVSVGNDEDLFSIQTDGSGFNNPPNLAGKVHSIAISPHGRYIALVLNSLPGIPTNQIVILDTLSNLTSTINLVTPVTDGPPLKNIDHADVLTFSPDGGLLIYDALSQSIGADGQPRRAWSIFGLNMATLQQQIVVPTVDGFDIGNPCFSRTSGRFVVFDANYSNGNTGVIVLDLYEGRPGLIGVSYDGLGYPVFNGDDTRVLYGDSDPTTSSGRTIFSQDLSTNKTDTFGSRTTAIIDAKMPIVYRRGAFPFINTTPTVALTAPSQDSKFNSPATVTLSASAMDIDGSISRVDFFSGEKRIATDATPPYSITWRNLASGNYSVYARVYDNQGASATSAPLRFTVVPLGRTGVMNHDGIPGFQFSLRLPQTGLYRIEASTNLIDWISLGSFNSSTNIGYSDPSATNYQQRFYRGVSTP